MLTMPMIAPQDAAEAVLAALRDLQPDLEGEHVQLLWGFHSRRFDLFSIGWRLLPGAPEVVDHEVVVVEGRKVGSLWQPTGEARPEVLNRGVVAEDDSRGFVVAATNAEGETDIELVAAIRDLLDSLEILEERHLEIST